MAPTLRFNHITDPKALVSKFIGKGIDFAPPAPPPATRNSIGTPPEGCGRSKDPAAYMRWWRAQKKAAKQP